MANSPSRIGAFTEQSGEHFADSQDVMNFMQAQLIKERNLTIERDHPEQKTSAVRHSDFSFKSAGRLRGCSFKYAGGTFRGVLLSELYDDVPIEDAPYFSALYGPARHAIVVRDISAVKSQLDNLEDCPEDLYLIEGDPTAFDDNVLDSKELAHGVVVQISERELRYSKFPEVLIWSSSSRKRLEELNIERDEISNFMHKELWMYKNVNVCIRILASLSGCI